MKTIFTKNDFTKNLFQKFCTVALSEKVYLSRHRAKRPAARVEAEFTIDQASIKGEAIP